MMNQQQPAVVPNDYSRFYNVDVHQRVICEALNCTNEGELRHPLCKSARFCSHECMNTIALPIATPPTCCEEGSCKKNARFCSSTCANKISQSGRGRKRTARSTNQQIINPWNSGSLDLPGAMYSDQDTSQRKRRVTNLDGTESEVVDDGIGAMNDNADSATKKGKLVYQSEAYIRAAEKKKALRRERRQAKLEAALRHAEAIGDTNDVSVDVRFNDDMDEALNKAVALFGTDKRGCWVKIAAYVGRGVDNMACLNRWKYYLDPALETCKTGPWDAAEVQKLIELVPQHLNQGARDGKDTVNWTAVSKALNRTYKATKGKWKNIETAEARKHMKRGPFTPEEDSIILQRRQEWESNGRPRGMLWPVLERELNRRSEQVHSRWKELDAAARSSSNDNRVGEEYQPATVPSDINSAGLPASGDNNIVGMHVFSMNNSMDA